MDFRASEKWIQTGSNIYNQNQGANGAVGINTTSPTSTLTVSGTELVTSNVLINGSITISGINNTTSFQVDASGAANALTVISGGNVGIGTTSPDAKLTIQGANDTAGGMTLRSAAGADYGALYSANGNDLYIENFRNTTDKLFFGTIGNTQTVTLSQGNVGIGTTIPSALLHVGGANAGIRFDTSGIAPTTVGTASTLIGSPTIWLNLNVSGTNYKIPCYAV